MTWPPATTLAEPVRIDPWFEGIDYAPGVIVHVAGSTFIATGRTEGSIPPDLPWQLLAAAGPPGAKGITGLPGTATWRGQWQATGVSYAKNDVVEFNGSVWGALATNPAPAVPPPPRMGSESAYWKLAGPGGLLGGRDPRKLKWRGAWSATELYDVNDLVLGGHRLYRSLITTPTLPRYNLATPVPREEHPLSDDTSWQPIDFGATINGSFAMALKLTGASFTVDDGVATIKRHALTQPEVNGLVGKAVPLSAVELEDDYTGTPSIGMSIGGRVYLTGTITADADGGSLVTTVEKPLAGDPAVMVPIVTNTGIANASIAAGQITVPGAANRQLWLDALRYPSATRDPRVRDVAPSSNVGESTLHYDPTTGEIRGYLTYSMKEYNVDGSFSAGFLPDSYAGSLAGIADDDRGDALTMNPAYPEDGRLFRAEYRAFTCTRAMLLSTEPPYQLADPASLSGPVIPPGHIGGEPYADRPTYALYGDCALGGLDEIRIPPYGEDDSTGPALAAAAFEDLVVIVGGEIIFDDDRMSQPSLIVPPLYRFPAET